VFYKSVDGELVIIVIAIDDLTLTSSSEPLLIKCKVELGSKFKISQPGPVHWLLGVEVKRDRTARTITLLQKAYINSIAMRFHLEDAPPISTPMEIGLSCPGR